MLEVFGVLCIAVPTVAMTLHFDELCAAGKGLAFIGLSICYAVGVFAIKDKWD